VWFDLPFYSFTVVLVTLIASWKQLHLHLQEYYLGDGSSLNRLSEPSYIPTCQSTNSALDMQVSYKVGVISIYLLVGAEVCLVLWDAEFSA
jgi:hypothetical protein